MLHQIDPSVRKGVVEFETLALTKRALSFKLGRVRVTRSGEGDGFIVSAKIAKRCKRMARIEEHITPFRDKKAV